MPNLTWFAALLILAVAQDPDEFSAFVKEVEQNVTEWSTYVLPLDNGEFPDSDAVDYGMYDFIIVGGGTAGSVLAYRLTETNFTVLMVEAGKTDPPISKVAGLTISLNISPYSWGYNTTPQSHACQAFVNKQCPFPRGKALGGSSVTNGAMYVRGNAQDYDDWAALGNDGWSYGDVLPYFKKSERAQFPDNVVIDRAFHGFDGVQPVDVPPDTPELTPVLIEAYKDLGLPELDYNGASQLGVGRMQFYLDHNVRASSSYVYAKPAIGRSNFELKLEAFVTNVLIDKNKTAYGIEFAHNDRNYRARARKEVILSAGAINSPQILMLSGIGPADHLSELGIELVADLPVGQQLLDHVVYTGLYFRTNELLYNRTLEENLYRWRKRLRPLMGGVDAQVVSFFQYENGSNNGQQPDVETFVLVSSYGHSQIKLFPPEYAKPYGVINDTTDFLVGLFLLHPKSAGSVKLQSKDPKEFPLIDTNYFADERDLTIMYEGIRTVLSLNDTKTFREHGIRFYTVDLPNCAHLEKMSKEWWFCSLRSISSTLYHPVGTTRMGRSEEDSVVDKDLKVHGIQKLRVVDAGVFPSHTSGHTNAPVVMVAEKISDVIKAEYS